MHDRILGLAYSRISRGRGISNRWRCPNLTKTRLLATFELASLMTDATDKSLKALKLVIALGSDPERTI